VFRTVLVGACRRFASAVSDRGLDLQFRRRWVVKVIDVEQGALFLGYGANNNWPPLPLTIPVTELAATARLTNV
jgi:hypothetical protein